MQARLETTSQAFRDMSTHHLQHDGLVLSLHVVQTIGIDRSSSEFRLKPSVGTIVVHPMVFRESTFLNESDDEHALFMDFVRNAKRRQALSRPNDCCRDMCELFDFLTSSIKVRWVCHQDKDVWTQGLYKSKSKDSTHVRNFPHIPYTPYSSDYIKPTVVLNRTFLQEISCSFFMHFLCQE